MYTIYFKRIIKNQVVECSTIIKAKDIRSAVLKAWDMDFGDDLIRVVEN